MRVILVFCLFLLPALAQADNSQPSSTNVVKGDVLYWEGDELVVKDISGRELRLRVNGETKISGAAGRLKTGDKIEATMTPEGHATSIALQIPPASVPTPGTPP